MKNKLGLVIDPGKMSGLCLFQWGDDLPFNRTEVAQVSGGAWGLRELLLREGFETNGETILWRDEVLDALIVEKFTPRQHDTFNLTEDSVEPLRCEGMLTGLGFRDEQITWQPPAMQYFAGRALGNVDHRKMAWDWLRSRDLYLTGKQVGQKDAHDAMSATLHAVAYLRNRRHMPTLEEMFS